MADPTIVLVHGAFADASGFRGLYDELLGEGVTVVAPPNPLRGLTGGDGEYLKAVAGEIDGPVLLVGHSYGGSVITAAGAADNVVGLVYISGFAPDEGENLADLQSRFPRRGPSPTSGSTGCPKAATSSRSRLRAFTSHSAPTSRPMTPRSTRAPSAPSPVLRSPRPRRPRRGAAVRSGRCFRPPTGVLTPASTASATTVWARR
jgi:pimeloyl-ACP methyl ester carboxylesterase